MSGSTDAGATTSTAQTGRYLYCLVELDGRADTGEQSAVDVAGIEGAPVSLVTADRPVGALVHPRTEPFDSADLTKLRDWLLAHQRVVEAAGDRFGTPLPVRFDTVLGGDDETVTAWLDRNADQITEAFETLTDCWEYRVTLSWDATEFEAEQRVLDSELADIDGRIDCSDTGTQFLLEKQYDQRLRELVRQRRAELTEQLLGEVEPSARRLTERPVQSEAAASLGIEMDSDAVAQVALLAPESQESTIGSALDELADTPGVEVRFTGPWPPYSFAPELTDEG